VFYFLPGELFAVEDSFFIKKFAFAGEICQTVAVERQIVFSFSNVEFQKTFGTTIKFSFLFEHIRRRLASVGRILGLRMVVFRRYGR
jgi:hypothetical protein